MTAVQKACQTIPEQAWTDEEVAQHFAVLKVHLILLKKDLEMLNLTVAALPCIWEL